MIGVDVEYHQTKNDFEGIAKIAFSKEECKQLNELSFQNKINHFYQIWTMKEAIIKSLGLGFSYDTKNFTINIQKRTVFFDDTKNPFLNSIPWFIQPIFSDSRYSFAVAAQNRVDKIIKFIY